MHSISYSDERRPLPLVLRFRHGDTARKSASRAPLADCPTTVLQVIIQRPGCTSLYHASQYICIYDTNALELDEDPLSTSCQRGTQSADPCDRDPTASWR